ncbi:leptin receptor gene-related protein-like [Xenia sp. Carnegie-2017]|uniref:leptin receptor gene-related protein-like n=1 Tax=Xenia sp. Carnegie-2017 TaxID=2897299 RepID=UPI001F0422EC|nr:leptin receptor gene-related protein-like [Xenia sp. Carnegie-2017]
MAGIKVNEQFIKLVEREVCFPYYSIILLSLTGAIGILLVVLGCALPDYGIWWPFFVLIFYLLAPVPTIIANRLSDSYGMSGNSNLCKEIALFLTSGIVLSAFGLPVVLARSKVIEYGAMALVFSGNIMMFCSILAYFIVFEAEDDFGF